MRIRRTPSVVIAALCVLFAGTALAADDDFNRNGYYVVAGGSYGFPNFDTSGLAFLIAVPPAPLSTGQSWGLNVRAGNRVQSWLAFEIQYEWMDGFEISQATPTVAAPGPAIVATYHPDIVTVNAKFVLPLWRVQPYAIVGGGLASYDVEFLSSLSTIGRTDNGFAFRGGGGVDAYITKNLVVFAEGTYVINTDSTSIPLSPVGGFTTLEQFHYISISAGFAYRF